jgi:hypothetical protein
VSWKDQARKDSQGKYIKLAKDGDVLEGMFLDEPTVEEKESNQGKNKGQIYKVYNFPVEVDGQEKIFSVTNKRLLRQIIEEDDDEPIVGRYLRIKQIGDPLHADFKIKEIPRPETQKEQIQPMLKRFIAAEDTGNSSKVERPTPTKKDESFKPDLPGPEDEPKECNSIEEFEIKAKEMGKPKTRRKANVQPEATLDDKECKEP